MPKNLFSFCIVAATGGIYFIFGSTVWHLTVLLAAAIITRLQKSTRDIGRLLTMLFVFCGITTAISELGIGYPESLILILTCMIVVIFYEGPEWGQLYFGSGETKRYTRFSLLLAMGLALMFGTWIYLNKENFNNPVPIGWPVDALIVVGIGFAFYVSVVEEIIFRSIILQRATAAGGALGVASQAVFYGAMHYILPVTGGIAGVFLGAIYGFSLGYLVKKSNSIYLSIFVHFLVSLVIFVELIVLGFETK